MKTWILVVGLCLSTSLAFADDPAPFASPTPSPLMSLQAKQSQYTAAQIAILTATLNTAAANPSMAYFPSAELNSQQVPLKPVGAGRWQCMQPLAKAGAYVWQVLLKDMDANEAASYEKTIQAYEIHIAEIVKELAQTGLTAAQKTALQAQENEDQEALRQYEEDFSAAMKPVESDTLPITVNPAPSPSPSSSPSPSPLASHSRDGDAQ